LVGHYTPNVRSHWLAGALVDSNFEPDVYANLELRRATRKRRGMAKDVVPIDAQKSEPRSSFQLFTSPILVTTPTPARNR
jgi:hypothetical protein